jgi:hypothetical protein
MIRILTALRAALLCAAAPLAAQTGPMLGISHRF